MEIMHVSAECYPMAKVGGLADVAGALPKYQNKAGHTAKLVMPMHRTKFLLENDWEVVHKGAFPLGNNVLEFTVIKETGNKLGFDLYCVDIYGLLDREKVYGYEDDTERYLAFQIAVLEWLSRWEHRPDVVHIHDHHAGLIPFMMQNCFAYEKLRNVATVLTIHNAEYQGWMSWDKAALIPAWDTWKWGLLDWDNLVNPLATAVKTAYRVTTVSPGYMKELFDDANGLETLFKAEFAKCRGIINGIDYEVWNPATDTFILDNYSAADAEHGKALNKKKLCDDFGLDKNAALVIFIGRLVSEKAADLLPAAIQAALAKHKKKLNFLVLGNGNPGVEAELEKLKAGHKGRYHYENGYNEKLSHQMYAGADFLLMPSRVEPCGLNQLYSLRYGTMPIVRSIGGLKDTVIDMEDKGGYGIRFLYATVDDIALGLERAADIFQHKKKMNTFVTQMMAINNSWESSAGLYLELYKEIVPPIQNLELKTQHSV